jgi:predicted AAA+ superfamily ATPase
MDRALQGQLTEWKNKPNRLPLLLQGARQVGKTHLMKWFGQHHFQQSAYFNFDERPELNPHCAERPNLGLKKNIFAKFQTILGLKRRGKIFKSLIFIILIF